MFTRWVIDHFTNYYKWLQVKFLEKKTTMKNIFSNGSQLLMVLDGSYGSNGTQLLLYDRPSQTWSNNTEFL